MFYQTMVVIIATELWDWDEVNKAAAALWPIIGSETKIFLLEFF